MDKILEFLIEKAWNNIDFWQVLFITVVVSFVVIKISIFINNNFSVFHQDKKTDLAIYKKTATFFSEDDMHSFLDELQEHYRYKKSMLQKIIDFESLMSSPSSRYKKEFLKDKIEKLLFTVAELKEFLVVNFAEETDPNLFKYEFMVLLPEAKQELSEEEQGVFAASEESKKTFYFQKERELKELIQKMRNEYFEYRESVKKYLNV